MSVYLLLKIVLCWYDEIFFLIILGKRYANSSSEDEELGVVEVKGETPIISTRKTIKKNEADALLNDDDDDIQPNHGFESSVDEDSTMNLKIYKDLLAKNGEKIKADPVTEKHLDSIKESIFIDNANLFPGGATKLAPFLKKNGGGHPKVVKALPEWLAKKVNWILMISK